MAGGWSRAESRPAAASRATLTSRSDALPRRTHRSNAASAAAHASDLNSPSYKVSASTSNAAFRAVANMEEEQAWQAERLLAYLNPTGRLEPTPLPPPVAPDKSRGLFLRMFGL